MMPQETTTAPPDSIIRAQAQTIQELHALLYKLCADLSRRERLLSSLLDELDGKRAAKDLS